MLRRLRLLLIAFFALSVGGASAAAQTQDVVFINPGKRGEIFWELVAKGMEAAAVQLDFKLEVLWAERDRAIMRRLGMEVLGRGPARPDFLVLVNEDNAAPQILAAAETAGVRSIFLVNSMSEEQLARIARKQGAVRLLLGSVEPDMRAAGRRMAARLVAAAEAAGLRDADGKLHLLALAGDEMGSVSAHRTQGMLDYVATRPDVAVDRLLFANWSKDEAEILTRRYLALMRSKGIRPAGIWAASDPIAQGAMAALRQAGLRPGADAMVVGLNWSPEAIDLIDAGELLMTDGGHFLGGGWLLVALRDQIRGCDVFGPPSPRLILFETSALDRDAPPELRDLLKSGRLDRIDFSRFLTAEKDCAPHDFSRAALMAAIQATAP